MAFPTPVRRATAVSATSNSTSWTPSWTWSTNTEIANGDRVIWAVIVSSDGSNLPTGWGSGWTEAGNAANGTVVTGWLAFIETTDAYAASALPTLAPITFGSSEQYSATLLAFRAQSGLSIGKISLSAGVSSNSNGSSTNSNPPSITNSSGASRDVTVVCTRSGDSTVVATAAPTNYSNLQTQAGGGTGGASTNTAERQINIANSGSEDPGTFTSASEQWACFTFGIYEYTAATASFPPFLPNAAMKPLLVR